MRSIVGSSRSIATAQGANCKLGRGTSFTSPVEASSTSDEGTPSLKRKFSAAARATSWSIGASHQTARSEQVSRQRGEQNRSPEVSVACEVWSSLPWGPKRPPMRDLDASSWRPLASASHSR